MSPNLLIILGLVGVCWGSVLENKLLDFVHGHNLGHLQQSERILYAQLIACAERYELKEFLEVVDVQSIMRLLVDLPSHLSHDFAGYLSKALTAESFGPPRPQLQWTHRMSSVLGFHNHRLL